jgi:NADH:ubiquinone oxidoreductase subunit E
MERTEILKRFKPEMMNMLGMLHELQNSNPENYLTEDDMKEVAQILNTTYSHVYGVVTYYTMFSLTPRGKYIIRVCNSPVCDMEGSPSALEIIEKSLKIKLGETTPDGLFSLEHTECLGQCDVAPSMMVGKDIYGHIDGPKITEILGKYK